MGKNELAFKTWARSRILTQFPLFSNFVRTRVSSIVHTHRSHTHKHTGREHPDRVPISSSRAHLLGCAQALTPGAPWRTSASSKVGVVHSLSIFYLLGLSLERGLSLPETLPVAPMLVVSSLTLVESASVSASAFGSDSGSAVTIEQ